MTVNIFYQSLLLIKEILNQLLGCLSSLLLPFRLYKVNEARMLWQSSHGLHFNFNHFTLNFQLFDICWVDRLFFNSLRIDSHVTFSNRIELIINYNVHKRTWKLIMDHEPWFSPLESRRTISIMIYLWVIEGFVCFPSILEKKCLFQGSVLLAVVRIIRLFWWYFFFYKNISAPLGSWRDDNNFIIAWRSLDARYFLFHIYWNNSPYRFDKGTTIMPLNFLNWNNFLVTLSCNSITWSLN